MSRSGDTTKVVEFEIRGNTVNFQKSLTAALSTLDQVEAKLQRLSTNVKGKGTAGTLGKVAGISSAISTVGGIRKNLTSAGDAGTPAQLSAVSESAKVLAKVNSKLGSGLKITNDQLKATSENLKLVDSATTDLVPKTNALTKAWTAFKALALAMLLRKIAQSLVDGINAAINLVETVNLFNVAIKNSDGTLQDFAKTFANAFNIDISDVYTQLGTFNLMLTETGATAEQASLMSKNLTSLTYDLASVFNEDIDTMATAVRSGMTGISKTLKQYGIVLTQSAVQQEADLLGITTSWQDLSELDKYGLRYITLLKQTGLAQGDFARTLESPQNQLKILKAQLEILFRNFGSIALILLQQVLPLMNGFLIALNEGMSIMASAAGYEIEDFTSALSWNSDALANESENADDLSESLKSLLTPFDELNVLTKDTDTNSAYEMDPAIASALEEYSNMMDNIKTKADQLGEVFGMVFDTTIFKVVGEALGGVFKIMGFGITVTEKLFAGIGYLLKPFTSLIKNWNQLNTATKVFTIIGLTAVGVMATYFAVMRLGEATFAKNIAFLIQYIGLSIKDIAIKLKNIIVTKALAIAQWWHNASLAAKIVLVTGGLGVAVVAAAGIAAAVMSAKKDSTSGSVPAAASGGVVSDATLALVGEGRYSEAIVPLENSPQFASMKNDIADAVAARTAGAGSGSTNVHVYLGGKELGNYLYKVVNDEQRGRTGISLDKLSQVTQRR